MPTFAQIRAERKNALRGVRARERQLDTKVEVLERLVLRLLDRKTVLTAEDARRIADAWANIRQPMTQLQSAIADFFTIVSE